MDCADITFVILTKNEAANITACLRSLPTGSRALVYDALSEDATAETARSLGATVVQQAWRGFVQTREAAAAMVTTPWMFMLDADERVTPELTQEMEDLTPAPAVAGYSVSRRNYFCGRWIRSGGWWPDRLVRLMRTGQAHLRARGSATHPVHEAWQPTGVCLELGSPIDHYSYRSVAEYRRKFSDYTDLEAQGQRAGLSRVMLAWLLVPLRFGWLWLRRGGILEGWRGTFVCAGNALYPAVAYTKAFVRTRGTGAMA